MAPSLSTSIKMVDAAAAVLRRVEPPGILGKADGSLPHEIWIDPMLLALSMELALKGWWVFDHGKDKAPKIHNLAKLFAGLSESSRVRLDQEFKRSVAPQHPLLFDSDYGIDVVLEHHATAFTDWRYMHEAHTLGFRTSAFTATLEMVISEFRKRYTVTRLPPPLSAS